VKIILQLLGIVALLGILAWSGRNINSAERTEAAPELDLVKNQSFLAEHPTFLHDVRELILSSGYDCPRVSILWLKGESAFGTKLEALCGPQGSTDLYKAQHYSVYRSHRVITTHSDHPARRRTFATRSHRGNRR
jgi:hypothetical protein